ncbi:helix-turn-helix domain-containing protein [Selenomonas dianae]
MSQSAFAEMLGTKRDTIANYEGGRVEPTDTFIQLLCTKFHINEQWLRTGEGEMRSDEEDAILEAFSKRYDLTPDEQTTARYMLRLSPEQRAAVLAHVKALAAELTAQVDAAKRAESAAKEQRTMTDEEIEADVAAYRAALIAEKEAASASSSGSVAKRA